MECKQFLFLLLVLPFSLFSQLSTSNSQSPYALVKNVLLGQGVVVSNIKFTGKRVAIGSFDGSKSNIGLSGGIVMTTGFVTGSKGPIGPNNRENAGGSNGAAGYSMLGGKTFDAAVLEFDFVPSADTVSFRYVFGSEEFKEFVDQEFNDKFAFYISGYGITGTKNMALLPNGAEVSINNVNHLRNSQYFIDNNGGSSVQYDGFTKVLTARSAVKCGKKYHLIIAIADVADRIYDSGVFLEAKSLTTKVEYEATQKLSKYLFPEEDRMAEGCVSSLFTVTKKNLKNDKDLTVPIKVSGSAILGQDISNTFPSPWIIPKGKSSDTFSFRALADLLKEPSDSIVVDIFLPNSCDSLVATTFVLFIEDIPPLNVSLPNDTIFCEGVPIFLSPLISGGYPPYSLLWDTGSTTDSIKVLPTSDQSYQVTVNDFCLTNPITVSNVVHIPNYIPLTISPIADMQNICPFVPTFVEAFPANGGGGYLYAWYQDTTKISMLKKDTIRPPKTVTYTVLVSDRCGDTISTKFNYTVLSPPLIPSLTGDTLICYRDSTQLIEAPTGGLGQYTYRWQDDTLKTPTRWVKPIVDTWYTVYIGDDCKTFEVRDRIFISVRKPIAQFEFKGNPITDEVITMVNLSPIYPQYTWTYKQAVRSAGRDGSYIFKDSGAYQVNLQVTDSVGCTYDTTQIIKIYYPVSIYIPNAFTPNGNLFNNTFFPVYTSISEAEFLIFNRWGQLIFKSKDLNAKWDGTYNGIDCPVDVYIYKVKTKSILNETKEFVGHVSLLR